MYKHKAGHAVSAVRMALAVIPLTACDSGFFERAGARLAEFGFPAQRESGAGLAAAATPTSVEHRHFDFYTRYRAIFDALPENLPGEAREVSGGLTLEADMPQDAPAEMGASCSMRMLLMQD